MDYTHLDFSSRLSTRAIAGGILIAIALMFLFMSFAGGLGLWNLRISEISNQGMRFWIWTLLGSTVSHYAGGYASAVASRSTAERDGKIHGLITWASICVLSCAVIAYYSESIFGRNIALMSWGLFSSSALAMAAAIWGGIQGVHSEVRTEEKEKKEQSSRRPKFEPAYGK
ncbi:MAG: hypothetical protein ACXVLQ_01275 [Bacteriovorax sp.]